jgi:hypothetical protein
VPLLGKGAVARLRFTLGTRYALGGGTYLVRQVLPDARLAVEHQASGERSVVST